MQVTHLDDDVSSVVLGGQELIEFSVSHSAEFYEILAKSLYTNPRLAMVREILCNADDAHIAAGREATPFQITLDQKYLTVKDFGPGIAQEDMAEIYAVHGGSTKRDEHRQTGGFGLGCKSPFAYTDSFEVISCANGVKTIYRLLRRDHEADNRQTMRAIVSVPTEETGLTVRVPIQQLQDVSTLRRYIRHVVELGSMTATLDGDLLSSFDWSQASDGWALVSNVHFADLPYQAVCVKYGAVVYPIHDIPELAPLLKAARSIVEFTEWAHRSRLVLVAEPGSIALPPSREGVLETATTLATLQRLLQQFLDSHAQQLSAAHAEVFHHAMDQLQAVQSAQDYQALLFDPSGKILADPETDDALLTTWPQYVRRIARNFRYAQVLQEERWRLLTQRAIDEQLLPRGHGEKLLQELGDYSRHPASFRDWFPRRAIVPLLTALHQHPLLERQRLHYPTVGERRTLRRLRHIPYAIKLNILRKRVVLTQRQKFASVDDVSLIYVTPSTQRHYQAALAFFTERGYQVIDLVPGQRQELAEARKERAQMATLPDPTKPPPPAGLVTLDSLLEGHRLNCRRVLEEDFCHYSEQFEAVAQVTVANNQDIYALTLYNINRQLSRLVAAAYRDRIGVVRTLPSRTKWLADGKLDLLPFLEQELWQSVTTHTTLRQHLVLRSQWQNEAMRYLYWLIQIPAVAQAWQLNLPSLTPNDTAVLNLLSQLLHCMPYTAGNLRPLGLKIQSHLEGDDLPKSVARLYQAIQTKHLPTLFQEERLREYKTLSPPEQAQVDRVVLAALS